MQVDPQFAIDVVFDARILLVMESIEGPAHHRVNLHPIAVVTTMAQQLAEANHGSGIRHYYTQQDET